MEEVIQIIEAGDCGMIGLCADSPVPGGLRFRAPHVVRSGTGVVRTDLLARPPAEQLHYGLSGLFSEQIPQRQINRGTGPALDAGGSESDIGDQIAGYGIDR